MTDLTRTVDTLHEAPCFPPFYDTQSPGGHRLRHAVTSALGRLDTFGGEYSVGNIVLPAMTVTPSPPADVPPGFDPGIFQLAKWFSSGGLVHVDPASVTPRADPYAVLPQAFGLAQLFASGALGYRGGSIVNASFCIAHPISRFPAGLYGAHSVSFLLGRGVPMPAGSPGHSCLISEETGLAIGHDFLCSLASDD